MTHPRTNGTKEKKKGTKEKRIWRESEELKPRNSLFEELMMVILKPDSIKKYKNKK